MSARKQSNTRNLAIAATALVGALFAGGASAMADPDGHRDVTTHEAQGRVSGFRVIEGRVNRIAVPIRGEVEAAAERPGRLIGGRVGRIFDAERVD